MEVVNRFLLKTIMIFPKNFFDFKIDMIEKQSVIVEHYTIEMDIRKKLTFYEKLFGVYLFMGDSVHIWIFLINTDNFY